MTTTQSRPGFSPRDLARALGVSESSVKRWVDEGALTAVRTAGGHRRIAVAEAVRFIREKGTALVDPSVLTGVKLPAVAFEKRQPDEVAAAMHKALAGDQPGVGRGLVLSLYLSGWSLASLFDGPMRTALERIGEEWLHGELGIVVEHRALDTCLSAIAELRTLVAPAQAGAPIALGGAPAGDPYLLPSLMASTIVADEGFADKNLGPDTPVEVMVHAVRHYEPKLVWLTSSGQRRGRELARDLEMLAAAVAPWDGAVVVGGRALEPMARLPASVHQLQSMAELAAFAKGLRAAL